MLKFLAVLGTGVVGAGLAVAAAFGVIHANTSAPSANPAANSSIQYGNR